MHQKRSHGRKERNLYSTDTTNIKRDGAETVGTAGFCLSDAAVCWG